MFDKKNFFHPSLFYRYLILDPGSEIRDPGWVKIRIRDPGLTSRIRNTVSGIVFVFADVRLRYRYLTLHCKERTFFDTFGGELSVKTDKNIN